MNKKLKESLQLALMICVVGGIGVLLSWWMSQPSDSWSFCKERGYDYKGETDWDFFSCCNRELTMDRQRNITCDWYRWEEVSEGG